MNNLMFQNNRVVTKVTRGNRGNATSKNLLTATAIRYWVTSKKAAVCWETDGSATVQIGTKFDLSSYVPAKFADMDLDKLRSAHAIKNSEPTLTKKVKATKSASKVDDDVDKRLLMLENSVGTLLTGMEHLIKKSS
tara:strand:- start:11 stop:418 length:408 start_codon:yes stop_codon:yes gene_type:complete